MSASPEHVQTGTHNTVWPPDSQFSVFHMLGKGNIRARQLGYSCLRLGGRLGLFVIGCMRLVGYGNLHLFPSLRKAMHFHSHQGPVKFRIIETSRFLYSCLASWTFVQMAISAAMSQSHVIKPWPCGVKG